MRGPSYLGLTRSISWLLMPWLHKDISSNDIDYVEYVGPGLTWEMILSTCVISMGSSDIKWKYMFIFPMKNLARKELMAVSHCLNQYRLYHRWSPVAFTCKPVSCKCSRGQWLISIWKLIIIPPASTKLKGGYTGFTSSVRPSVCPSVHLWTKPCPLCIVHNTSRIHFIFAHLIKQLQKVCRVWGLL